MPLLNMHKRICSFGVLECCKTPDNPTLQHSNTPIPMQHPGNARYIPHSLAGLAGLAAVLVLLVPPEQTLGHIIKAIFVHAALVQTELLTFAAAGLLGLVYLGTRRDTVLHWCEAAQKTGVLVWTVYIASSVIVTYLAWGIPVAWNEPRVRISAIIWGTCLAFLLLQWLAQHRIFTAIINVLMAVAAWLLVKSAGILRHPFDPIGSSDLPLFKIIYAALGIVMLLLAIQIMRWWHLRLRRPTSS